LTLGALEAEQRLLQRRIDEYGDLSEPMDIWAKLGVPDPAGVSLLEADAFIRMAAAHRAGAE
jgi:malonate decarboxylase beta subunit